MRSILSILVVLILSTATGTACAQTFIDRILASKGNTVAKYRLGNAYLEGREQDPAESFRWHLAAAEQGHEGAQYRVGYALHFGVGISQDHVEAVKWYRKAAKQGHVDAQFSLGFAYTVGRGVPQDHTVAAKWYREAAEHGDAFMKVVLGHAYYDGIGVKQDYFEAVKWWKRAEEQGSEIAELLASSCEIKKYVDC